MTDKRMWDCKIGEVDQATWDRARDEHGALDGPMRKAVEEAYERIFEQPAEWCFSGWGDQLGEQERAVIEDRLPDPRVIERELKDQLAIVAPVAQQERGDTYPTTSLKLHSTTDARVWAAEFLKINGAKIGKLQLSPSELEHVLLGWFANAIETGRMLGEPTSMATDEDRMRYRCTVRLDEEDWHTEPNVGEMGLIVEDAIGVITEDGASGGQQAIVKDGRPYVVTVVPGTLEAEPESILEEW